ncbi:putative magnesium transporter NIPA1 isoform X2 [Cucumis melo var. makuwa]|uniref:Probable magnesium transporter n=1 Tax=Cucumis melo var. makuwa TaxID=1194695 RepID=A0A5D3BPW3_CUCMM|nr:putative magnesium transporter NIPA1 isoform X2 [Cucumis melo var. makuwa]
MGISSDNVRGFLFAVSSSVFIGSSTIIKKKGLIKSGAAGTRAAYGGFSYLCEPWWWAGMITLIVGETANFVAYAYAPAILVTPLGALSIIFSAVLAHFMLKEKLHIFGILGCVLCVVGSTTIVLHAPLEKKIESVKEVWHLATEPVAVLIFKYAPRYGQSHMIIYVGICSLMGSLTVMSVKAVAIAAKLTFEGMNQFKYFETWFFSVFVVGCCILQVIYLNKHAEISA